MLDRHAAPSLGSPAATSPTMGCRATRRRCGAPCPADLDGSSAVDFAELVTVLAAWGPCP